MPLSEGYMVGGASNGKAAPANVNIINIGQPQSGGSSINEKNEEKNDELIDENRLDEEKEQPKVNIIHKTHDTSKMAGSKLEMLSVEEVKPEGNKDEQSGGGGKKIIF